VIIAYENYVLSQLFLLAFGFLGGTFSFITLKGNSFSSFGSLLWRVIFLIYFLFILIILIQCLFFLFFRFFRLGEVSLYPLQYFYFLCFNIYFFLFVLISSSFFLDSSVLSAWISKSLSLQYFFSFIIFYVLIFIFCLFVLISSSFFLGSSVLSAG
jgi:hypothetical protein